MTRSSASSSLASKPGRFRVNLPLLRCKLFLLALWGSIGCYVPYISLYYKQLGFSPADIGLMNSLRPFVGFVAIPLIAAAADRFRCRRFVLVAGVLSGAAVLVVLAVLHRPPEVSCDLMEEQLWDLLGLNLSLPYRGRPEHLPGQVLIANQSWLYDQRHLTVLFVVVFLVTSCVDLILFSALCQGDVAVLEELRRQQGSADQYGWQRGFGALGWGLGSLAIGLFLGLTRTVVVSCGIEHTISDYRVSFLPAIGFTLIASLLALPIEFTYAESANEDIGYVDLLRQVMSVLLGWHYGSVVVLMVFLGMCNGAIWTFLYWHLENLGATQILLGFLIVLHCIVEFLCGSLGGWFIAKLGHVRVLSLGLSMYILRFVAYCLLTVPWHFFFTEILHGLCFILTWTTAVSYLNESVQSQYGTTVQGLLTAAHHGLGVGLGVVLTGLLIDRHGAPGTFARYAVTCGLFLAAFLFVQWMAKAPPSPWKNEESAKSRSEGDRESDKQLQEQTLPGTESLSSAPSTANGEKEKLQIHLPPLKVPTKAVKAQISAKGE